MQFSSIIYLFIYFSRPASRPPPVPPLEVHSQLYTVNTVTYMTLSVSLMEMPKNALLRKIKIKRKDMIK